MIYALCLLLGLSIALNISFSLFLLFILKNKRLEDKVYETFNNNVEVIKESKDPFKNI